MNVSFDPTAPAEVAVVQRMLDGLSGNKTIEIKLEQRAIDAASEEAIRRVSAEMRKAGPHAAGLTPPAPPSAQACDAMDDTGGIRKPVETGTYSESRGYYDPNTSAGEPAASASPFGAKEVIETVPGSSASFTAAAPPSPSAPEAPRAGAPVDPSVFGQSAALGPVPPAPTAPAVPTSPAVGGERRAFPPAVAPERDVNGIPYDKRIHSSSGATNADGTWRQRRNLPDGLREQVEAELRGASGATSPTTDMPVSESDTSGSSDWHLAPAAPAVSAPPLPPAPPAAPVAPPVPSLPAIPSSTPPAAAPAPAAATASGEPMVAEGDFVALFGKLTKLVAAGTVSEDDVKTICESLGLPREGGMMQIPARPELVLQFDAAVEELFA